MNRAIFSLFLLISCSFLAAQEPPALNPFSKQSTGRSGDEPKTITPFAPIVQEREDAVPGYVEMSDGTIYPGLIYLTRDKRLQLYDAAIERQRQIPLTALKKIECRVKREWMEKEWRFKELASDEKYFTGREYPSREYLHKLTLKDDRTLDGPMDGLIYVQILLPEEKASIGIRPEREETGTKKLLLHKRQRGDFDEKMTVLTYVKLVEFGDEALEKGQKKFAQSQKKKPATTKNTPETP